MRVNRSLAGYPAESGSGEAPGGRRPINLAQPDAVGLAWPSQYKILRPQLRGFHRHSRIADSSSAKARRLFIGPLVMTSSQRVQEVRYAGRCRKVSAAQMIL